MKLHTINKNTKTAALLAVLREGRTLTPAQARKELGIANIRAEATRLRQAGYAVYATHPHKRDGGQKRTAYLLGNPSRKVIAAGYAAIAKGLV
jgi:hypothetical protein